MRIRRNEGNQAFPVANTMYFDQKYNTHTKLINISASLTEKDKTKYFNIYMKYVDWTPPSYGYLQQIPGRDEVISLYVS